VGAAGVNWDFAAVPPQAKRQLSMEAVVRDLGYTMPINEHLWPNPEWQVLVLCVGISAILRIGGAHQTSTLGDA
jgi:hypothetical protein